MNRRLQKTLITIHRWIGIAACLYLVVWFCSGAVMMYVRFPKLNPEERVLALQPIDWSQVSMPPDVALARIGLAAYPRELRLEMSRSAPVYRAVDWDKQHYAVSAVDGTRIQQISERDAEAIANEFAASGGATVEAAGIQADLWSVITERGTNLRPFYRVALNDALDRKLYISSVTGEIVLDTSRQERWWNYVGAVPHWLYLGSLRSHPLAWRWVVMCSALVALFVAVTGIWLGISFIRVRKRYPSGRISPWRGWLRWHHIIGTFGGIVVLTWLISGWLSVGPNGWLLQRPLERGELERYAGQTQPRMSLPAASLLPADAKIARFTWIGGQPIIALTAASGRGGVIDARSAEAVSFAAERIFAGASRLLPDSRVVSTAHLLEPDEYWHTSYLNRSTPILRVRFDDAANTWFHIDPRTAEVVALLDDTGRANRWLFDAIHDLDFHFLLERRPLWDILLLVMLSAGTAIAVSGVVLGWRRLRSYAKK